MKLQVIILFKWSLSDHIAPPHRLMFELRTWLRSSLSLTSPNLIATRYYGSTLSWSFAPVHINYCHGTPLHHVLNMPPSIAGRTQNFGMTIASPPILSLLYSRFPFVVILKTQTLLYTSWIMGRPSISI